MDVLVKFRSSLTFPKKKCRLGECKSIKNLFVSHRYHAKLSIVIHEILKKKYGHRVLKLFLSKKKMGKKDAPIDN